MFWGRKPETNPLKIGACIKDFQLKTTEGNFSMHKFLTGDAEKPWTVFFSHPKDFTPVCTTELGECHSLKSKFGSMGAKLIGLSCDPKESHVAWGKDVLANVGDETSEALNFPLIADDQREIVSALGMLDPEEKGKDGVPLPARALVILHGTTVRLTILYPATTGRNFDEVFRVLTSLQLTQSNGLATPVDWMYGERVIVGPALKTEEAQEKFEDLQTEELPSKKPYLRSVKCPPLEGISQSAIVANTTSTPQGQNPLRIGATLKNFPVKTTHGDFNLHDMLKADDLPWTIFFSHPKDFTPVCTTELGACHKLAATVSTLGCKLIGLSCDDVDSHREWSKDVLERCGCGDADTLNFPIIADSDRAIVTELGMLDPEEKDAAGIPLPARALVILKGTTVKLTILYPATTGRNFEEVVRTLISLQLTDGEGIATPVNWTYGQRVIVAPSVDTEDAKAKFQDFHTKELPSGKPYLRSVRCPDSACARPGYYPGDMKLSSRDSGLCFCSIQ